jgi:hypothetical protein
MGHKFYIETLTSESGGFNYTGCIVFRIISIINSEMLSQIGCYYDTYTLM